MQRIDETTSENLIKETKVATFLGLSDPFLLINGGFDKIGNDCFPCTDKM